MTTGRRGMLWMAGFVAGWTVVEAIGRLLHVGYSGFQVVWSRYVVHIACLLMIVGHRGARDVWRTHRLPYQLGRGLLMAVMPAAVIIAQARGVDMSAFMALFWITPIFILVLARASFNERPDPRTWIVCVAGFAATIVLLSPERLPSASAAVLAAAMALSFGAYVPMTRSLRTEATRVNLFYTALVPLLVLTPLLPRVWKMPSVHDALVLAAIGVAGLAALYALDRAASLAPVSASAPVLFLTQPLLLLAERRAGIAEAGLGALTATAMVILSCSVAWFGDSAGLAEEVA
ncbi:MAG: EamA family transporter [Gemmatimonadales bacterium]